MGTMRKLFLILPERNDFSVSDIAAEKKIGPSLLRFGEFGETYFHVKSFIFTSVIILSHDSLMQFPFFSVK